ncbi:MAG: host-nuclease inhibitor Gam family protein [Patescibacteria group bacterium]
MAKKKIVDKAPHQVKMPAKPDYEVYIPENLVEAANILTRIAAEQREINSIENVLNDGVAVLQKKAMAFASSHNRTIAGLVRGLFIFADANRETLTEGGKTKTIQVPTGSFGWRLNPPSVHLRDKKAVIKALKKMGLKRFVRIVEDPNKEAMLEEPAVAVTVPGVKIKQEEIFSVKPNTLEVGVEADVKDMRVGQKPTKK